MQDTPVKLNIVKQRSVFVDLRKSGEAFFSKNLILQKKTHPDVISGSIGENLFGFTVSRKVGCAVVRNKVKRRLKAIIYDLEKQGVIGYATYVIIARNYCAKASFQTINKEVKQLLKKSESIKC